VGDFFHHPIFAGSDSGKRGYRQTDRLIHHFARYRGSTVNYSARSQGIAMLQMAVAQGFRTTLIWQRGAINSPPGR